MHPVLKYGLTGAGIFCTIWAGAAYLDGKLKSSFAKHGTIYEGSTASLDGTSTRVSVLDWREPGKDRISVSIVTDASRSIHADRSPSGAWDNLELCGMQLGQDGSCFRPRRDDGVNQAIRATAEHRLDQAMRDVYNDAHRQKPTG